MFYGTISVKKIIVVASEWFFKNTWVQKAEMEIVTTKLIFHLATAKHDPPMLYHLNVCENMTFVTFCLYTCMMGKVFLLIRSDQDYVVVNIEEKEKKTQIYQPEKVFCSISAHHRTII